MAKNKPKRRIKQQKQDSRWLIYGGIAVVVLVGILVASSLISAAKPSPAAAPASSTTTASSLDQCGKPDCGQPNAPVTIDIYADFQCPYCAQADGILRQLAPQYIETGKARLVYHNMAILGPESQWAAQAAECAADQNKFWAFGDYLFTHQNGENQGAFTLDNLKKIAASLGLNTSTFNSCLDSNKYVSTVQQQTAEGQQRGVAATPTFFINGKKYEGVIPADQLSSIINAAQPQK